MGIGSGRTVSPIWKVGALVLLWAAGGTALAQPMQIEAGPTPPSDAGVLEKDGVAKAVAALPAVVADVLQRSSVPGAAVAVVHDGKVVFAQGFGVREIGKGRPVDAETVFQIASVSKSISATVAAIQVTRKIASWDDPVARYLRDFRLGDPYVGAHATIGDFFAHRSGLPATAGDELEDLGFGRAEIIRHLGQLQLGPFRNSYHYANFGTTIAAEAVAAAAGQPWEKLAEDSLFKPLGMRSTSYRHADYLARDNRAVLHAYEAGQFRALFDRNPDAQAPAGGVSSNVLDLAEWLKLLLAEGRRDGEPLVASQALLAALQPQAVSAPSHSDAERTGFYGYGFNVNVEANGRPSMSHSGAFLLGAGTNFRIVPSARFGIVVLTNGGPVGAAEAISANFTDIAMYGAPTRDWFAAYSAVFKTYFTPEGDLADQKQPADARPAHPLGAYVGHYENAYFGPAEIRLAEGRLELVLGPQKSAFELRPWDRDMFAMQPSGENAPPGSLASVRFSFRGAAAGGFTADFFDKHAMGRWRRK